MRRRRRGLLTLEPLQRYLLQRADHLPDDGLFLETAVAAAGRQDDRQHVQHQRKKAAPSLLFAILLAQYRLRCSRCRLVRRLQHLNEG
jgi:hypothetical protein